MNLRFALLVLLSAVFAFSNRAASTVRINEFVASNSGGLVDDDGQYSDWIELYNSGTEAVELDEWFLTDDPAQLTKWEFPTTTLPAGGYLVVFASGKNRNSPQLHTNFSLQETGEYLALVDREGQIVSEFSPTYPSQRQDVSYGYDANNALVFFTVPTPGGPNGGGVVDFVKDTKFSVDRGFYDAPFDVTIVTATPDATIRYTTDGIPPTATTGLVYTGPIHVTGTTTLRAAAFKTGLQPSNVDTQTYIFLEDVIHQSPNGTAPPGWPSSWGGNSVDYGMDPDVVNDPRYKDTIKNDLKTIPTFSLVMKLDDLFNSTSGIYAHPDQDGAAWERPCSLELINPDGTDGFQINAGIRIRGGFSRSTGNPKHAFRLFFNQSYGAGKLNYPLFGKNGADQFDKIDLRTFQNYSWSFQGDASGVFLRDQFSRDTQLEMGHQAERGNFYHLYINGQYWGLYNTDERPEAAYAATYFGGLREDYDTIKVAPDSGYTIYATDGNMTAWTTLYNLAKAGLSTDAAFQKILGNNPDGTPNPDYPVLIDLPNLIDYMLVIIYTGNLDAPISNFLSNQSPNNWFGVRNRNIGTRMGFQFFAHDSEHTLLSDLNIDRTGPFTAGDSSVSKSSPQYIWKQLTANAEFRLKVADHIQRHFFNGGLLTPQANAARFSKRKAEIDRAVVGESARWGDAKRATPLTRDNAWVPAINNILNNYFPNRGQIVLNQLKADGLYPNVAAPSFNQQGGGVDPGFVLTMSGGGTIYYTLDGTDPRLQGGSISSKALTYSSAITLNQNATVKARVLSGNVWSAMNEADFLIIRTFKELMITELMYNPLPDGNTDGDQFEFIELKNIGSQTLDLSGIHFTNGVEYVFPSGTQLPAGALYVLVSNPTNFASRYPNVRIDGVYTNNLSNSGEAIALIHAAGTPIAQFAYDDQAPWPTTADGAGFSLVPRVQSTSFDYSNPANWRASSQIGGSPGADEAQTDIPAVVINEVLLHADPLVQEGTSQQPDSIELYNPTLSNADISGWYLSNDLKAPTKFLIPSGTVIAPGGYVVLDRSKLGAAFTFPFSASGGEVYLFSATGGTLTGYSQGFKYTAPEFLVSFGRYTNSVGEVSYPPQISTTLGSVNAGPRVGPVVINEIQYQPALGGDEFVELKNITGSTVRLYDSRFATNTWKISGLDFTFPQNVEIPANGIVVISGIEPELFRQHSKLPAQIPIYGPFSGSLQNNGELLELLRPAIPVADGVPYNLIDSVRYSSNHPWPTNSAGTGSSIERRVATNFGNDPLNWRSSPGPASPGLDNDGNRLPIVSAGRDIELVAASFPVTTNITGSATDDGLPNPPHALTYAWTQLSGPGPVQFQSPNSSNLTAAFPGVGVFILRLSVSDGEFTVSDDVSISISRPLADTAFVAKNSAWKYYDKGTDLGTAWRAVNYSDAGWASGAGILGYGDPVATTIGSGPDSNAKYTTTYFRRVFTVNGAKSVAGLTLRLLRDDGAVVYLNGVEVLRSNMPQGDVNYSTLASNTVGGGDESTYFEYTMDPSLLLEGQNLFAVEVHQVNGTSTDLGFDLELVGQVNFSNQPPSANAGSDLTVQFPGPVSLNGVASDDGLPNPPGVFNATWSMVSGPGSVSFANANSPQTTATFSVGGTYLLHLGVTDGELTASDEVQITVNGGDPYSAWRSANFSAAELGNPAISGDDADPDGDSFTNKQEFIAGTKPKDGTSYLHVTEVDPAGGDIIIRFEAIGDKSYSIEARDAFVDGVWDRVVDLSPQGATKMIEVLDTLPASNHKFYRIVTPQQPPR